VKFSQLAEIQKNTNPGFPARGPLIVPHGAAVRFEPTDLIGDYPRLLTYFQPNDLQQLRIPATARRSNKLISNIGRLQGLNCLELADCKLEAGEIKTLEPLKNLRTLNISRCNLSGENLAQSGLISNLNYLNIAGVKDVSPVVELLNPNLYGLVLNQCILTTKDLEKIARQPALRALYLNGCKISDKDLSSLVGTKSLVVLDLEGCDNLTKDSLLSIQKIKSLRFLKLPAQLDSQEFHLILRSHLPELKFDLPSGKI
jgi:hypothetical protein